MNKMVCHKHNWNDKFLLQMRVWYKNYDCIPVHLSFCMMWKDGTKGWPVTTSGKRNCLHKRTSDRNNQQFTISITDYLPFFTRALIHGYKYRKQTKIHDVELNYVISIFRWRFVSLHLNVIFFCLFFEKILYVWLCLNIVLFIAWKYHEM